MHQPDEQRPLEGVTILDLTHAYSGPFCTMNLADQGATVWKVEPPGKGDQSRSWAPQIDGVGGFFAYANRNKYGIALDLKTAEGQEIFKKLVAHADVVCENFRRGTMEHLGLGYETLREVNPGLIYASVSGFGLEGPLTQRPCYDNVAQAMGGLMSLNGFDRPTKVTAAMGDSFAGAYLAMGISMALYQRTRTGKGRRIDVAMLDTVFSILGTGVVEYTLRGRVLEPSGNRDMGITPMDSYDAKDGSFVMACGSQKLWENLCAIMGQPELNEDPRFCSNGGRCEYYLSDLKPILERWAAQHTLDELEPQFLEAGIPFGRIQSVDQVCKMDAIRRQKMLWKVQDHTMNREIEIPGCPVKMQGSPDEIQRPAPLVGEHTEQVLRQALRATDAEMDAWHRAGAI